MKFKKIMRLLPLSHTPRNGRSILDWRPFKGGDTIDKIVNDYNKRCFQSYQKLEWPSEYVEKHGEGIEVVLHDLSTVDQLRTSDFAGIRIILIDLDAIGEKMTEIDHVRGRLLAHEQCYFLPQISQTSGAISKINCFRGFPVFPSRPEIIINQETFENWLGRFCKAYQIALQATDKLIAPPRVGIRAGKKESMLKPYQKPKVAAETRDAAIIRDLSDEETVMLATLAAIQEFTLDGVVERIRTRTKRRVIVDAIRTPPVEIPIKPRASILGQINLVELRLTRPMRKLTTEQRDTAVELGIKGENLPAVHVNRPTIQDKVENLKDVVEVTEFTAALPFWIKGS